MFKLQVTVGEQLLPASSMECHWLAVSPPDASVASICIGSASSKGQSHLHPSCPTLDSSQAAISAAAFPRKLSLSFPVRSLGRQASCHHSCSTYGRHFAGKAGQWLEFLSQTTKLRVQPCRSSLQASPTFKSSGERQPRCDMGHLTCDELVALAKDRNFKCLS